MYEEKLKQRLNEIDKILDDESISDDEFNELEDEARRLTEEDLIVLAQITELASVHLSLQIFKKGNHHVRIRILSLEGNRGK